MGMGSDPLHLCMAFDLASEEGEIMWSEIIEGRGVLLECPSRWYLVRVARRSGLTVTLDLAICGHLIQDLGQFLDGLVPSGTELTVLPRPIEVNLGSVDTAQEYPLEYLQRVRKRTHDPVEEK